MNQLALTLDPVRARKRDPETSREAARKAASFANNHSKLILAAIGHGGTYKEIADRCGLERHAVARRLKELESVGSVYRKEIGRTDKGAPIYEARNGCAIWRLA